ncbi:ion transporter [Sulfurimonas paralvinellae]|uniref:BK channel n=1 Tax=Sulfurimonas paralvinellae TaxID=317658 RepID=A0A7M1B9A1_9BACT|nr:ion transporter [Sulfurimonas paralvinellae]QOP46006.1 potassium transporter TrkA [Sulfurimonas paralvinellae]
MLKRWIINFAYYLDTSKSYQKRKRFFYNILEDDKNKYKKYIDIFMAILIFISVGVLIREVKHHVDDHLMFFSNYVISFIFLIEYLLRFWVSSSVSKIIVARAEHDTFLHREVNLYKAFRDVVKVKLAYMLSPMALIDLFAILPFYHELRLLRLFILFRVFKLFRYAKSLQTLSSVLATKKFEFLTLGIFAAVVIFISSVLIYVMEGNNPASPIDTLYEAIYWAIVTISTVGYGDMTPVTHEGRFVAMLVIIAGISVLAFTTSLFVSAFTEKLDEIREMKTIEDVSKLKKFYLICGYEHVAREVARKLSSHRNDIIVMDEDEQRVAQAKKDGFTTLHYNPGRIESYEKLGIDIEKQVKAILCLRENDIENVYAALTIRSINKEVFILSLLMSDANKKKMTFAGINLTVYPQELVGLITKELVGKPVAFEVIHELRSENADVKIDELGVTERIVEYFPTVGDLGNKDFRVVLLGIYKQSSDRFYFNPLDDMLLEVGDYLLVVGYQVFILEFEKYLHTKIKASNE